MALTIQVVGHKKTGKTLVTAGLIKRLTRAGLSVAAIKHDAHDGNIDQPGTDSDRLYQAGANQVVFQSRQGSFQRSRTSQPLANLVDQFQQTADVVVIEGHKAAHYPKLILLAPGESRSDWAGFNALAFGALAQQAGADLIGAPTITDWLFNYVITHYQKEETQMSDPLTHFNDQNRAKMVDVTAKQVTARTATATGTIRMQPATLDRIHAGTMKKGDVLAVAQVAGIMAAKQTSNLIPMCHLIPLTGIDIHFTDNNQDTITATATVKTKHVTGVEIEALLAVQTTLLTIYDMCKAIDRGMVIDNVHLVEKDGGKSGHFQFGEAPESQA